MTGLELRAARNSLKWTQKQAAAAAGIGHGTYRRFESQTYGVQGQSRSLTAVRQMYERHGFVFGTDRTPRTARSYARRSSPALPTRHLRNIHVYEARSHLGLSAAELSERSGVTLDVIRQIELSPIIPTRIKQASLIALRNYFRSQSLSFLKVRGTDLVPCTTVVSLYIPMMTWYRLWRDVPGWMEQFEARIMYERGGVGLNPHKKIDIKPIRF